MNDIIARDSSLDDYRANLAAILDGLLEVLPPGRIFLVTTPDHTLTARGARLRLRGRPGQAQVTEANAILAELGAERGITVVDISPVNERGREDRQPRLGQGPLSDRQAVRRLGGGHRAADPAGAPGRGAVVPLPALARPVP